MSKTLKGHQRTSMDIADVNHQHVNPMAQVFATAPIVPGTDSAFRHKDFKELCTQR